MRVKIKNDRVVHTVTWKLNSLSKTLLNELEQYNRAGRSWADEIGEFQEEKNKYVIPDLIFLKGKSDSDKKRIIRERNLYQKLRCSQPRQRVKIYHVGKDIDKLVSIFYLCKSYEITKQEMQNVYKVGESYVAHGKNRKQIYTDVEKRRQEMIREWQHK